jgi:hypothetical protein
MALNRNRVIYSAAALYVGPTPATGQHFTSGNYGINLIKQVPRVQNFSTNFDISRQDVNQLGQLAALDRISLEPPTVNADFSWLLVDGKAESVFGFAASGQSSLISGFLDKTTDEKNVYILLSSEGVDAVGDTANATKNVLALGNTFLSNYSIDLAVGQLPTASLSLEALNIKVDTGNLGNNTIPAVNPINGQKITGFNYQLPTAVAYTGANIVSALRPGDIQLNFPANAAIGNILSGAGSVNVQSVNISLPLARETLNRLGSPFAFSRELQVPIQATMSVSALAADLRSSNLADILCNDQSYDFNIVMKKPDCEGTGAPAITLDFKNAKLQSQDFSIDIGGASTVNMTFQSQLAGIGDTKNGVFFSGSYS